MHCRISSHKFWQSKETVYVSPIRGTKSVIDGNQKELSISSFDASTFLFFVTWTVVSCPPNILFQSFLEEKFPAKKDDPEQPGRKMLDKSNTVKKFFLDQTISATLNTVGYIAAIAAYRGKDTASIIDEVRRDFWPLMQAGWKLWPMVSLLNFTVIPLSKRTLVGSLAGLGWGIYMSLLAAR